MELKQVANKIKDFLKIRDIHDLPTRIHQMVLSDAYEKYYDEYISIVGGIDTDYIQKIYQFWLADRGKGILQQDYTPPPIAKLVAELANCTKGGTVFDCCAGTGALTIAKHRQDNSVRFVCQELDDNVIPLLLFNLAINRIEAIVMQGNALSGEIKKIYSLKPGNKYSSVEEISEYNLSQYDACICNPPYNIPWEAVPNDNLLFAKYGVPPKENANFAFILNCLYHTKSGGKAVLILPNNICTSQSEAAIRANLSKAGCVDSIITLPDKMFESTDISTCVLTLRNKAGDKKTTLIDSRKTYHEEVRNQRGEGDKAHTERIYHKTLKILADEDISKIIQAIKKRDSIPNFCASISITDFAALKYIWQPSYHIQYDCEETKHRAYADIVADLRAVSQEKSAIKITMNQTVAKKLGWEEVAQKEKIAQDLIVDINNRVLKLLEIEPIKTQPFICLSPKKAGGIKIENTRKDSVSSVFMIFLPMFKQHIYYLNTVENKLLAELRDAILPDLMSGNIDVSKLEDN